MSGDSGWFGNDERTEAIRRPERPPVESGWPPRPPAGEVYRTGEDRLRSGDPVPGTGPEPAKPAATQVGDGLYRSRTETDPALDVTAMLKPVGSVNDPEATITMPAITEHGRVTPDGKPVDADEGDSSSVFRNSAVMAAFTVLSRLLGYLRTAVMGVALGGEVVSNAYTNGQYSPLMVYELLLGGTLSSVVVPLLVRAKKRDRDRGQAYTQRLVTLAFLLLVGATVLVLVAAPLIAYAVSHGVNTGLVTSLSYIMLPAIFFYGMSALFQAILNTRGSFAAPTWAPMLNNLVVIAFFAMFHLLWPVRPGVESMTPVKILILGSGFTLGIAVQAVVLLPALRKAGFHWRFRFDFRALGLRRVGRLGGWAVCYVAISQVGLTVVINIANAATKHHPDVAGATVYDNAYLLMMMINGIAAVSVMTALMPRMSAAAADHRYRDVAEHLSMGTRMSSVLLVPGTMALLVLGTPLAVVLFRYGNYSQQIALATGLAVSLAGLGLIPFAISQMQIFAFYAMPDTRTPALINVPVVVAKVLFDLAVLWFAAPAHVVALLLSGNAVSFVVATVMSYWLLRRRIGRLGLRLVTSTLIRLFVAAGIAGLPAYGVVWLLRSEFGQARLASLLQLAAGGAVLLVVYFVAAYLLRVREVSDVVGMVRRRLGR